MGATATSARGWLHICMSLGCQKAAQVAQNTRGCSFGSYYSSTRYINTKDRYSLGTTPQRSPLLLPLLFDQLFRVSRPSFHRSHRFPPFPTLIALKIQAVIKNQQRHQSKLRCQSKHQQKLIAPYFGAPTPHYPSSLPSCPPRQPRIRGWI